MIWRSGQWRPGLTDPAIVLQGLSQHRLQSHHANFSRVSTIPALAPACALTIGNFDGVHRGHQAMLALLRNEAQHRDLPATVLTFEPHPRDYFAALTGKSELAPARIATLRDKLSELERCGVDQVVVVPFDQRLASADASGIH
jgi:riboflavin kinase/FMN adenylyltransferase